MSASAAQGGHKENIGRTYGPRSYFVELATNEPAKPMKLVGFSTVSPKW